MIEFKKMDRRSLKTLEKLEFADKRMANVIRNGWYETGSELVAATNQDILRRPKGGKVYMVSSRSTGRRRRHRASAAGETHANMFGDLRRSLDYKVRGDNEMAFGYGPSRRDAPPYAAAIEFGNKKGTLAARPSLRNNIRKNQRNAEVNHEEAFEAEFS
jgi:hypothetical protein